MKMDKKRFANIYANHPKTIVNQYFGFSSIVRFEKAKNHHFNARKWFWSPKIIKSWQKEISKHLRKLPLNDCKWMFCFSIVRFEKVQNHHFQCQEVILEPKNHWNWTKRDLQIFTHITLNWSYINIMGFFSTVKFEKAGNHHF